MELFNPAGFLFQKLFASLKESSSISSSDNAVLEITKVLTGPLEASLKTKSFRLKT
jgi:hypothetical protein